MINLPRITVQQILRFEPQPGWFARSPHGIHGLAHETRVLVWGQLLASMVREEGITVNADVIGWAAVIHDTQRWDDGIDREHGIRAAEWLREHSGLLPDSVPLDEVAHLCEWHVPADHNVPEMTDELKVFKDSDALDRWRIGDLDPQFLRIQAAHLLLDATRELWAETSSIQTSFSEILATAVAQGVLLEA